MDLLGGLRSTMEGERELMLYFRCAKVRKKRHSTVGKEGEGYKYPQASNNHLSRGSAAAQVRQCHTTQDSKGKNEVQTVLAMNLRIHVYV